MREHKEYKQHNVEMQAHWNELMSQIHQDIHNQITSREITCETCPASNKCKKINFTTCTATLLYHLAEIADEEYR